MGGSAKDDLVVTSNGKPVGILIGVDGEGIEETLRKRSAGREPHWRFRGCEEERRCFRCRAAVGTRRRCRGPGVTPGPPPGVRIVLDTNVLVSGLLNPSGPPGRIVDLLLDGAFTVLLDDRIVREYQAVLRRPKFAFDRRDMEQLLEFVEREGVSVSRPPDLGRIARPFRPRLPRGCDLGWCRQARDRETSSTFPRGLAVASGSRGRQSLWGNSPESSTGRGASFFAYFVEM